MSWSLISRTLVVAAAAGLLATGAGSAPERQDVDGPGNHALLEPADTSAVLERTTEICETVLSYSYTDLDTTRRQVEELTTDRFKKQYDELFDEVLDQAPSQQLTLTSTVVKSAVRYLTDTEAQVLVYLDQTTTKPGSQSGGGGSMFLASLLREDGDWVLDHADFFGATR